MKLGLAKQPADRHAVAVQGLYSLTSNTAQHGSAVSSTSKGLGVRIATVLEAALKIVGMDGAKARLQARYISAYACGPHQSSSTKNIPVWVVYW